MTRSVNKTKQYTVLLEETLSGCYLTLLGSAHIRWGGLKPSGNINHGHNHSMDMSVRTRKADNLIDGCIMALKTNSCKYAFIS